MAVFAIYNLWTDQTTSSTNNHPHTSHRKSQQGVCKANFPGEAQCQVHKIYIYIYRFIPLDS